MQTITKEYAYLFHMVECARQELSRLEQMLIEAQQTAEEIYLNGETWGDLPIPEGFFAQGVDSTNFTVSYLKEKNGTQGYMMLVNNDYTNAATIRVKLDSAITSLKRVSAQDGTLFDAALSGGELVETTMADWLPGVVAAEMPASFAPEALRAQAVAARTYILQRMRGGAANHPEAGVCDQYTCCCARKDDAALREQWGVDYAHNMARIRQAVTDTDGQYLTYGGQLIRAVFHASSAGATESSAALWSGDAPYLVSVSSPETAKDVPNYVSTAEIAADAVRAAVLDSYPDCVLGDDPGIWFGTPELDGSGRVARIPVGSETLTGAQVRALFSLRSAAFSVAYSGGTFTFTVTGSGHGVGMSQYGANVMAIRGSGYADILAHYYPGTTLIRAEG